MNRRAFIMGSAGLLVPKPILDRTICPAIVSEVMPLSVAALAPICIPWSIVEDPLSAGANRLFWGIVGGEPDNKQVALREWEVMENINRWKEMGLVGCGWDMEE